MVCSSFAAPRVAMCFHGSARSFPHRSIHRSLRANVIDAFGAAHTTVFLNTKRIDARGDPRASQGRIFDEVSREDIVAAAKHLGVRDEHIRIEDGPNVELPNCSNYETENGKRTQTGNVQRTQAHYFSLAGQVLARKICMDMIETEENRTGKAFDFVILSRVDLTAYAPLKPFCTYNLRSARRVGYDWFIMASREKAAALAKDPYDAFYGCKRNLHLGQDAPIYFKAYFDAQSSPEVFDLPVLVTRLNKPHMPNAMFCEPYFSNVGAIRQDPPKNKLCPLMTWQNKFNSL